MLAEVRRVSYGFDSGRTRPYYLECCVAQNGEAVVRVDESYDTREEFLEGIEQVIPLFKESTDGEVIHVAAQGVAK